MNHFRHRIPFKIDQDENIQEESFILDEQRMITLRFSSNFEVIDKPTEQEELIGNLRKENDSLTRGHSLALRILVGLSSVLYGFWMSVFIPHPLSFLQAACSNQA